MATIVSHALAAVTAARLVYPNDRQNRIAIWAATLAMLLTTTISALRRPLRPAQRPARA